MKVLNQSDVEPITVEAGATGVRIQWLLDEAAGAPSFSMRRFEIEPGGNTPFHAHPWEHQVYIISGRGAVVAGDESIPLKPDDAVLVSPDEKHQFKAADDEPLCLLCLVPNGPATAR
ncbi:MAG TPA: cupin domain-containing protein [Armatimonadota bacterium]|nr:cupin domain-containing protein [Armatimonadota bacterium]